MSAANPLCHYFHFGLIVTGKGEREHLSNLFRSLMASGICHFQVIHFAGQRSPITSPKRTLKMVGQGKIIPDRDTEQIGLPARRFLNGKPCSFILFIDDLEYDRREQTQQIFERYRMILDNILTSEQQRRASVHFLVNMLEAYFFADANAVNAVLVCNPRLEDFEGNVEEIRHPKRDLRSRCENYDEIDSVGEILAAIDVEHVLSRPDTCAALRTMFAWCGKKLAQHSDHFDLHSFGEKYRLADGVMWKVTQHQE